MDELFDDAAARAKRYWQSLSERRVSPASDALARLTELEEPFPTDQSDPRAVLALLDEIGSPATLATAGPRFFGFVIGGALPATVAANWLASAWDQNAGLIAGSPIAARLEEIALGWMVDALGLPAGTGAGFVTGATMANFTALLAARHAVLEKVGWNVESDGLFGAPPVTVVVGDEAHPTLMRSLSMAGFGHQRVLRLPVDGQGRMRAEDLPELVGPAIVCIQAGNVNTGAFDPAADLCAWAHEHGRLGTRGWRVRPLGRRHSGARPSLPGLRSGRLLGDRRAQVAQRPVRQRRSPSCATPGTPAPRARAHRRLSATGGRARAVTVHAGTLTPRAWNRGLGRAEDAGSRGAGRDDRAQLPPGDTLRRGSTRRRLRHPQRGRAESGPRLLRRAGTYPSCHRRHPGRRDLLVRPHRLAGADRHAHQRLLLGARPTRTWSAASPR